MQTCTHYYETKWNTSSEASKKNIMHIGNTNTTNVICMDPRLKVVDQVKTLGITLVADTEQLIQLNITDIVQKVEILMQSWSGRALTPIGKIAVINSLIASQFVSKLSALPSPNKEFFLDVHKKIRTFILGGKKSKVKFSKLVQKLEYGGLQLSNLMLRNVAFKCHWIQRSISTKNFWLHHARQVLPLTIPEIWRCILKESDVDNEN